jgi:hypothetical protein
MQDKDGNTVRFWRGRQIGCYDCHGGVTGGDGGGAYPEPGAANVTASTDANAPVNLTFTGSGAISWRIVSQPANGAVGISNNIATYTPAVYADPGMVITDKFTFASFSGYRESLLATGTVYVTVRDTAGDGIPDWWRSYYFPGHTITDSVNSATSDPDGDGMDNLKEYLADTNPLDGRSVNRIFAIAPTNGNIQIEFTSLLGQKFHVERRDDLVTGLWSNFTGTVWGHTDATSVTDTNITGVSKRFYRIRLVP